MTLPSVRRLLLVLWRLFTPACTTAWEAYDTKAVGTQLRGTLRRLERNERWRTKKRRSVSERTAGAAVALLFVGPTINFPSLL